MGADWWTDLASGTHLVERSVWCCLVWEGGGAGKVEGKELFCRVWEEVEEWALLGESVLT